MNPCIRIGWRVASALLVFVFAGAVHAQAPVQGPNGLTIFTGSAEQPVYPVPYVTPSKEAIAEVLTRVLTYLETANPARIVNRQTGVEITDFSKPDANAIFDRGENNRFNTISYEWGVTYCGMLIAGEATGEARFTEFARKRLQLIADRAEFFKMQAPAAPPAGGAGPGRGGFNPMRSVLTPRSLDDSGSMCAAMLKAHRAGAGPDLRPLIDNYIGFITTKQFRLADGTFARRDPQPESLWLDDLYMSVPALAQMGKLTGERRYFDDAAKQIRQFAARMFNPSAGVFMHGWTSNSPEHPEFHWARANGWAILAMVELLDVLPEDHPQRDEILSLMRAHLKGLASFQTDSGLWHQILDRPDSYLETSATAIYAYCFAHAINRGWVSAVAYGPVAQLAWNAVATKVNTKGQVEGTCTGTGMAFDYAYYYHRPTSVYALHGYGPVLLAGGEMIKLLTSDAFSVTSGIVQFIPKPAKP